MRLNLNLAAREHFVPYLKREERWASVVAHRRAGKTVACIMDLIKKAVEHLGFDLVPRATPAAAHADALAARIAEDGPADRMDSRDDGSTDCVTSGDRMGIHSVGADDR